jgi:hypothetical protein
VGLAGLVRPTPWLGGNKKTIKVGQVQDSLNSGE